MRRRNPRSMPKTLTHAQAMEGLAEIGRMIVADADPQIAQLEKRIVGRLYINS
jgi:hypothetical protein